MRKQHLLTGIGVSFAGLLLLIAAFVAYQTMGRNSYAVYGVVDASDCSSPYDKTPRDGMLSYSLPQDAQLKACPARIQME